MDEIVGTPRMIKLLNKDVIEGIIKMNGPVTKPEIAKVTNLSLVTVNKTVDLLLGENKVKLSGTHGSTGGRPAQYYEINEELYYIIGLYYDRDVYVGAVANTVGEIIYQKEYPVRVDAYGGVMEDTFAAIDGLMDYCKGHETAAIGLGVPGVVKEGVVTNVPNIPGWEGQNIAELLEEHYRTAVMLENDINLAAMGVYHNHYRDKVNSLALVYLEKGIGSGLILNKELFKGATNFAGEISHIPAEALAGTEDRKSRYKGSFENRIMQLYEEMKCASGSRKKELKEILKHTVADGLLSIICVVNPEVIVLTCSQLGKADIKAVEELLKDDLDVEHIPRLVKLDNLREQSIQGVINMCIRETTPTYSLSSRKRG